MNFTCTQSLGHYERIPSYSSLELQIFDSDSPTPKEIELHFYNEDNSYKTLVVEENLRVGDLCQLLALKNHAAKDINWTVVEHIEELHLERSLEDHEDALQVYSNWGRSNKAQGNKFYFRKDFRKYEFFHNPQQFLPSEMVTIDQDNDCLTESSEFARIIALQNIVTNFDKTLEVSDHMWIKEMGKQVWRKAFFMQINKMLYYSYKASTKDVSQMQKLADLASYTVYIVCDGRKNYKAPTDFCLCLKPSAAESPESSSKDILCFACDTDKARFCWITTFRIAKFGNILRENFRSFKSRHLDAMNPGTSEYNSQQMPLESVRTRVAMDFTGNYGKIVEDPLEAEAIAVAEGRYWNKKRRPGGKKISGGILQGLDSGVHITQPWFHAGLSREEANHLLVKYGTVDGVFIVRNSRSMASEFVLSFIHSGKTFHTRVTPVEEKDQVCYSIDNGRTKFYDLLQLVEFYQLNTGCLPTKLTHYIAPSQSVICSSVPEQATKGSP